MPYSDIELAEQPVSIEAISFFDFTNQVNLGSIDDTHICDLNLNAINYFIAFA